jgi:6-phosphogluconolactonase
MSKIKLNSELVVPGNHIATLNYAAEHFVKSCREAIQDHEAFYVALSGGSTPKALFTLLCSESYVSEIEWGKVHLFWSDERAVPPTHVDNNYHMAMKAGFEKMLIPTQQIHRMIAEKRSKNMLPYTKKTSAKY